MGPLPISDEALINVENRRNQSRPARPPAVFYIYDISANACTLATVLGIIIKRGLTDPNERGLKKLRIFDAGNYLQDWWRDKLLAVGHTMVTEEGRARLSPEHGNWIAHGRGDLVMQVPNFGHIVCREVKTTKSAYYIKKEGQAKEEHFLQCQYYLNALGLKFGCVDYIDKTSFATGDETIVTSYYFEREPEALDYLIGVGDMLYEWLSPLWDVAQSGPITGIDLINLLASREIKLPEPAPCWKCNQRNRKREIYCDHYDLCQQLTAVFNGLTHPQLGEFNSEEESKE